MGVVAEPTKGWGAFEQACDELHAAAVEVARLTTLRFDGAETAPTDDELTRAITRASDMARAAKEKIRALSDAHILRVWRDWRPATQARIGWEADHVADMSRTAFAPITDPVETPAAAAGDA